MSLLLITLFPGAAVPLANPCTGWGVHSNTVQNIVTYTGWLTYSVMSVTRCSCDLLHISISVCDYRSKQYLYTQNFLAAGAISLTGHYTGIKFPEIVSLSSNPGKYLSCFSG